MIVVLDYGLGNLRAIINMFRKIGVDATTSSEPDAVASATRLVLPGVGAFDEGMRLLDRSGLREPLERAATAGTPVLGICLGMQLLSRRSDEGCASGLGWLAADTVRLLASDGLRIPHMGWNWVEPPTPSLLFPDPVEEQRFYFLHAYAVACDRETDVLGWTEHGMRFASAVRHENVFGVQFHPEKSHRFGMRLLERFSSWR